MFRSWTGLRIREPPVSGATQGPPSHALRVVTVDGVGIAHGGPPALGAQQLLRPGARAQGRQPRPPLPPSPLPPQCRHPQAGTAGDSELGADGRGGIRGIADDGFLAISRESCLIHAHGFYGLATLGLTLQIGSGHSIRSKEAAFCSRFLSLDVIRLQSALGCDPLNPSMP